MEIIERIRRFLRRGRPEKARKNETHEQRAARIHRNMTQGQKARWRRTKKEAKRGGKKKNE